MGLYSKIYNAIGQIRTTQYKRYNTVHFVLALAEKSSWKIKISLVGVRRAHNSIPKSIVYPSSLSRYVRRKTNRQERVRKCGDDFHANGK